MSQPHLTFFCELDGKSLQSLFSNPNLIADIKALGAGISLGILDFSPERAEIVHWLNRNEIPVTAWLLLPREQGYWFNLDNYSHAQSLYDSFREWTRHQGLVWDGIGLDIEPDIREVEQIFKNKWSLLPLWLRRTFERGQLKRAQSAYCHLVDCIHADGYRVECYQFPLIVDERMSKSTYLQRASRIVDVPCDQEVLMLYSHFIRPLGVGILWSYAPQAQAIAVGSTGGGVDGELSQFHPLSWRELERDLRLAWHWCDDLYIYSLEGCVQQGFLERLKGFVWDQPILLPLAATQKVNRLRRVLHYWLWITTHPTWIAASLGAFLYLVAQLRHNQQKRGRYGRL
jgi:hypothetical protein